MFANRGLPVVRQEVRPWRYRAESANVTRRPSHTRAFPRPSSRTDRTRLTTVAARWLARIDSANNQFYQPPTLGSGSLTSPFSQPKSQIFTFSN